VRSDLYLEAGFFVHVGNAFHFSAVSHREILIWTLTDMVFTTSRLIPLFNLFRHFLNYNNCLFVSHVIIKINSIGLKPKVSALAEMSS
jgi:hypothetical protein